MKKLLPLLTLALALLTLTALILAGCADMGEPIGTQPSATTAVTTDERDVIENPEQYTELALKAKKAIWAAIKDSIPERLTINDVGVYNELTLMEHKGAFVLGYMGCPPMAPEMMKTEETVLGYTFQYNYYNTKYKVFVNGKFYTLQSAYDEGIFTEEDIRIIWEAHNGK